MKKLILSALGALLLVAANPALSQEKDKAAKETSASTALQLTQCAFKVSGMTCGGCAGMVEQGLRNIAPAAPIAPVSPFAPLAP